MALNALSHRTKAAVGEHCVETAAIVPSAGTKRSAIRDLSGTGSITACMSS